MTQTQIQKVRAYEKRRVPLGIFKALPYYSDVRLNFTRTGTTPAYSYVCAAGVELRAFGYAIGDMMNQAGRPNVQATAADTNLQDAGKPIDGETVTVMGIGIQILSRSDFHLAKHALSDVTARIAMNGGDRGQLLGPVDAIAGGTGLFGSSESPSIGGRVASIGTNGQPFTDNVMPIPEKIVWQPAGNVDSSLIATLRAEREIVVPAPLLDGETSPETAFVDLRVRLYSRQDSLRSVNS